MRNAWACLRHRELRKQAVKFVVIPESKKSWVWELRSAEGSLVLRSPGSFAVKFQAVAQIEALKRAVSVAGVYDLVGARMDRSEAQVAP